MAQKKAIFNGENDDLNKKKKPVREDYSIPMKSDSDFDSAEKRDPDPFKTYSLRLLRGRIMTFIIAPVNIAAVAVWIIISLLGDNPTYWWIICYGLYMLASSVGLFFAKEAARKFFAIPAVLIGIPVVFALMLSPAQTPLFIKTSYQLAVQIVSAALLYFMPAINTFFTASPKAIQRALNHEWEKDRKKDKKEENL